MNSLICNITLKPYNDFDFYEKIFLCYALRISAFLEKHDYKCVMLIDTGNYTFVPDGSFRCTDYPIIHIAISSEHALELKSMVDEINHAIRSFYLNLEMFTVDQDILTPELVQQLDSLSSHILCINYLPADDEDPLFLSSDLFLTKILF